MAISMLGAVFVVYNGANTVIISGNSHLAFWTKKPFVKDVKILESDLNLSVTQITPNVNVTESNVDVNVTVQIPPSSCDPTPTPTPTADVHSRFTTCGYGLDFIPSTQGDLSNIDGKWHITNALVNERVYNNDLSTTFIDTDETYVRILEVASSSLTTSVKEFLTPQTHMVRLVTSGGSGCTDQHVYIYR